MVVFALLTGATGAFGQTLYWDTNGATAGTGANPAGTWSTGVANWSANSAGTSGTIVNWANWSAAVFSAGTNGTGSYAVTVSGNVGISSLTIEEGLPTFTGGTIQFSGTPDFFVASGSTRDNQQRGRRPILRRHQ
jgi:fibronectin-binding autotransporter adhesin